MQESSEPIPTHPARPRILLVEDYAPNVLVATTILEEYGYDCDVAGNGHEALERIAQQAYALVLMDVQMPGLDGFETTRMLRQRESEQGKQPLTVIAMTAHALEGDKQKCLAAGMNDYISKPFHPHSLCEKIAQYVFAEAAGE